MWQAQDDSDDEVNIVTGDSTPQTSIASQNGSSSDGQLNPNPPSLSAAMQNEFQVIKSHFPVLQGHFDRAHDDQTKDISNRLTEVQNYLDKSQRAAEEESKKRDEEAKKERNKMYETLRNTQGEVKTLKNHVSSLTTTIQQQQQHQQQQGVPTAVGATPSATPIRNIHDIRIQADVYFERGTAFPFLQTTTYIPAPKVKTFPQLLDEIWRQLAAEFKLRLGQDAQLKRLGYAYLVETVEKNRDFGFLDISLQTTNDVYNAWFQRNVYGGTAVVLKVQLRILWS